MIDSTNDEEKRVLEKKKDEVRLTSYGKVGAQISLHKNTRKKHEATSHNKT